MSYKFKFNKVGGKVCCQGDEYDLPKFCASCKAKATAQELAWRQENARRNDMRRKQQEEQARIDAARGNPAGKENQMRIGQGQGQNQTPAPAGCRCGKCGGVKPADPARTAIIARLSALPDFAGWRLGEMSDSALAELDRTHPAQAHAPAPVVRAAAQAPSPTPAPAPAPAASPLRTATIARLSSRLPVSDLDSMNDEMLAALDKVLTASASAPVLSPAPVVSAAPAPTLRELPDPWGINAKLEEAQRQQDVVNQWSADLRAAREHERNNPNPNLRPLPDTLGLKAAEARRAEEARSEEAKRLEEQRIVKENSGWGKVNAMLEAAQKEANANRAAYEAVEQARAAARNNPNSNLRPLIDPWGLKKFGIE